MIRGLVFVLVCALCATILLTGAEYGQRVFQSALAPVRLSPPQPWSPPTSASGAITAPSPPLSQYPLTAQRPVFIEGRRYPVKPVIATPPPPPQAAVAVVPPPKPTFPIERLVLRGIMTMATGARAMIEVQQGETRWFERGDTVTDWKIVRIGADTIDLEGSGGQTATLKLYNSAAGK